MNIKNQKKSLSIFFKQIYLFFLSRHENIFSFYEIKENIRTFDYKTIVSNFLWVTPFRRKSFEPISFTHSCWECDHLRKIYRKMNLFVLCLHCHCKQNPNPRLIPLTHAHIQSTHNYSEKIAMLYLRKQQLWALTLRILCARHELGETVYT